MSIVKGLILLLLLGFAATQEGEITVNTKTRFMVDAFGRSVIFHGVNVIYKIDPYIPSDGEFDPQLSLNDQDIDDLVKWGFNLVRLGVMWEAVERSPGVYDDAYLKKVDTLINKLGAKGIYTMVDAHQDVFARTICGEGMPTFYITDDKLNHECKGTPNEWAISLYGSCKSMKDYGYRQDEQGYPLIEDCNKLGFTKYYSSAESLSAFEMLYQNIDGLQDKFVAYWDKVASFFSNNEYVIGYDPINEPYPSDYQKDPTIVSEAGKFDKTILQPLYQRTFEIYQKYNQKKIMYYEPGQFPDTVGVNGGQIFELGFTEAPGGKERLESQVLNDHSYCCQKDPAMCAAGEPPLENATECLDWHIKRIGTRHSDSIRYEVPLIISEFGACTGSEACAQEIKSTVDTCDAFLVGWAYWEFKKFKDLTTTAGLSSEGFYEDDGTIQDKKVKALSRTYLKATQGALTGMKFNTDTGHFLANYTFDSSVSAPSVVYLSGEYYYQNGYDIYLVDQNGAQLSETEAEIKVTKKNHLEVNILSEEINGKPLTLVVNPKIQYAFE